MTKEDIRKKLFELGDEEYKKFHCKLVPGMDEGIVIGVRTPALRKLAKEVFKSGDYKEFLKELPHKYYEEMNLHGFIICEMKDYDEVILEINKYLPYVDNWATCDLVNPKKAFSKNQDLLIKDIKKWISSKETYTKRFGIEMLMSYYLDNNFKPEYFEMVSKIRSNEYYINMMVAWFFATALAKQYDYAVKYIEQHKLDEWTHKKTIQKARESFRINDEQKEYLKSLK